MKSFPIASREIINGEEFINLECDVFVNLFNEYMKYTKVPKELVRQVNKLYDDGKSIKRKRIRHKKQKESLLLMYDIMMSDLLKKG